MRNGQETRDMIIRRSAELFNSAGYSGSSISDVMAATGLKKGGIYRHFQSKDELALEAFDHAVDVMRRVYREAAAGRASATEKLLGVLSVYRNRITNPPVKGGCPLLNTAIESDDTHPQLNRKVRSAMDEWLSFIEGILREGIASGEFKADLNVSEVAVFLTSAFEGSIMMGKLYADNHYLEMYYSQLQRYLLNCVKQ